MGLLDDAIRDHLDLKRRRGADPAEVERAEREALGPVRRNPSPSDLAEEEDAAASDGGLAYDQAGEQDWVHDSVQDTVAAPAPVPPPFEDVRDALDEDEEPYDEEPALEPVPPPAPAMGRAGPDTAQYDVEDALAAEDELEDDDPEPVHRAGASDEDVLEETPEFLQDTPDHDRLWFEQRPPKDFDFDE
jgi:hypothetical protein